MLTMIAAVLLGATASHATAHSDEDELTIAKFLLGFVCEGDGVAERSRAWYTEYMNIQDDSPYDTGGLRFYSTAVRMIDDDRLDMKVYFGVYQDGSTILNPRSRQKICQNQQDFAKAIYRVVTDEGNKGVIKACCATEDGMTEFFERKFQNNVDLMLREAPQDIEQAIADGAKARVEEKMGKKYEDMDQYDKEDADDYIKDYKERLTDLLRITPEKIAEAKKSQPDKYKAKWHCNPDASGNCQV
ncbi:hypothetical protein ABZ942_16870 [Nocardia sp. NPDC046473]|uniref:hypothetical protein n=1 Tax=Nocardia sp. NPDC046473 TaxID=3155733 RepID=UPI0033D6AE6D